MSNHPPLANFGKSAKRIVATGTILRAGWEMDNEAWAVEMHDGSIKLFSTNHGRVCAFDKGIDATIEETISALQSLQSLRSLAAAKS